MNGQFEIGQLDLSQHHRHPNHFLAWHCIVFMDLVLTKRLTVIIQDDDQPVVEPAAALEPVVKSTGERILML